MSDRVYQACMQQKSLNNGKSDFVFCNWDGGPLNYRIVNKCIWHPILRYLGEAHVEPIKTRHTARRYGSQQVRIQNGLTHYHLISSHDMHDFFFKIC